MNENGVIFIIFIIENKVLIDKLLLLLTIG